MFDRGVLSFDRGVSRSDRAVLTFDRAIRGSDRGIFAFDWRILTTDRGVLMFDRAIWEFDRAISRSDDAILRFDRGVSRFDGGIVRAATWALGFGHAVAWPSIQLPCTGKELFRGNGRGDDLEGDGGDGAEGGALLFGLELGLHALGVGVDGEVAFLAGLVLGGVGLQDDLGAFARGDETLDGDAFGRFVEFEGEFAHVGGRGEFDLDLGGTAGGNLEGGIGRGRGFGVGGLLLGGLAGGVPLVTTTLSSLAGTRCR